MPPLPAPSALAPLDPHATRALTTIYAPRKLKSRKNKTAQSRMLEDLPCKTSISPFHPLPAIGQKVEDKVEAKTKVIVFDLKSDRLERAVDTRVRRIHDVLQPLSTPTVQGYVRKKSLEPLPKKSPSQPEEAPQQLIRENTYDVIEPVYYVNAAKVKKRDRPLNRKHAEKAERKLSATQEEREQESMPNVSPKTRFKEAARQVVKLATTPETGKLLCLRERQTLSIYKDEGPRLCTLQELPQSPKQKLTKLSEIFQCLDTKGRYRDRMKKENSWF